MGNPTGFMDVERVVHLDRPPLERVKDWNEFHINHDEAEQKKQGARCMDCGVPFCHTGSLISNMASGCPINNLIPDWNDLVYQGNWRDAIDLLHKTNNFPEFTGRVCPAPCEGSCVLGINEPPVTIKNNEVAIIDRAFEEGWVVARKPDRNTGKKVAVVGSGPAGLACAAQLNQAGHKVTVYERADRIGGLLMYGIPNMKLDKAIVQRRIDLMKAEGVEFIVNTEIGKDISGHKLVHDNDAVVMCCGATKPRDLPIEGRELKGVHFAMDYLRTNTKSLLDSNHADDNYINAKDKNVIVIGGGDTGTDCVGTALRHGCKKVTQLEILPKPPDSRAVNNPWPEWPKVYTLDYGQEEAAAIQGKDPRDYCVMTKKFTANEEGNLGALHIVSIEWVKDEGGRMSPKEVPGTEKIIPADLVFLAMGFLGPEELLIKQLEIETDARSNVAAEFEKYKTNVEGIFSAGDMRRGQSLIVWAINEGRGAARECDRFLMGSTQLP